MSDGKTHARHARHMATAITSVSVVAAIAVHPTLLAPALGAWAAVICDPDLDHHVTTESEWQVRRWSPVVGRLWSAYWRLYEWCNPHRGRSHTIPRGTLDRFLLLFWPLLLYSLWWLPALGAWLVAWWLLVLAGQCCVDAVHLRLDGLL